MFKRKIIYLLLIIIVSIIFIIPTNSLALNKDISSYAQITTNKNTTTNKTTTKKNNTTRNSSNSQDVNNYIKNFNNIYSQKNETCNSLLGSTSDEDSVAWLLDKILKYLRILGPLAVIVLSGIEFTKAIISSDDDTMKKATGHLKTRLFMAALLFLIPTITILLFDVFGIATDCGVVR